MAVRSGSLLGLVFTCLVQWVATQTTYIEDTLYMLSRDRKVIRLQDFMHSGLMTSFKFEAIDPIDPEKFDNVTQQPKDMEILPSQTYLYKINASHVNDTTQNPIPLANFTGITSGVDQYYLAQTSNAFYLIYMNDPSPPVIKDSISINDSRYRTLYSLVDESHHFLFFHTRVNSTTTFTLNYTYLDPLGGKLLTERLTFNWSIEAIAINAEHYKLNLNKTNTNEFDIFGYHFANFDFAHLVQFFYYRITLENGSYKCDFQRITMKMNNMNLTRDWMNNNYSVVSTGIVKWPNIQMVVKYKGNVNVTNRYCTINCVVKPPNDTLTTAECEDPVEITTFRLLSGTENRGIDLGYGQFGIISKQFLLYPVDDQFSRFDKVYMEVDTDYVNSAASTFVKFSEKNDKFITMAFGKDVNVTTFYIIEYLANPPEVYKNMTVNSTYFRLQGSKLFLNNRLPNSSEINHMAWTFQDAYVAFYGSLVESRQGYNKNSSDVQSLQFRIKSKNGEVDKESKNFTVKLVSKILESVELKLPYQDVKAIRGGGIALNVKEDYFVGNDILLNITTQVPNVTIKVAQTETSPITFKGFATEQLGKEVKLIKLLWDNLLFIVQEDPNSVQTASICFIKKILGNSEKMECVLKNKFTMEKSLRIQGAWLLNFNHLIVIANKTFNDFAVRPNDEYAAVIYWLGKKVEDTKNISIVQTFEVFPGDRSYRKNSSTSYICYTYSASALITFITGVTRNGGPTNQTNLTSLKFVQTVNNTYEPEMNSVKFDTSIIDRLNYFVPDYSSKYYFYVSFTDKSASSKSITYQARIKVRNSTHTLVKVKELSSLLTGNVSTNDSVRYCAGLQELVAIGFDGTNKSIQRLVSVPFKVKFPVYEKMVRRLPLESLNLTSVADYSCLGDHNSMIALAYNSESPDNSSTLVTYDLDLIHDPRRRIEMVNRLGDIPPQDIMLTASSASYAHKDYMVISYIPKNSINGTREFKYIAQPIKDINFEVNCPFSSPEKVPLQMTLYTPHLSTQINKTQNVMLEVRPLDYSTEIKISSTGKLQKKENKTYELEKMGLLKVDGHFFDVRLFDIAKNRALTSNDSLHIQRRLKVNETFNVENSLEIRKINDTYILREVTGNLDFYLNKMNRTKKTTITMQCNSLSADFVSNDKKNPEFYLFTVEDIIGGVIATFRQIDHDKLKETENIIAATNKQFSQTYEGIYGTPVSIYCGANFYFIMHSKITNELLLSVLRANSSNKNTRVSSSSVTIPLVEAPLATEFVCFNDGNETNHNEKNSSVALIVVFQNQSQVLYKYNGETNFAYVRRTIINLDLRDKVFFVDVECDIAESKPLTQPNLPFQGLWDITFKCFYSTRWADDLIIIHKMVIGPNTLQFKGSKILQEVQEIRDFDIVKIIMEDNRLLVCGFNLKEPEAQKKVYVMVYNFSMEGSSYVISYFNIDNYINLDYERFRQLIHVSNDGSIVYLDKSNSETNTFDKAYSLSIDSITLVINNTKFDPHMINMEILDIAGEVTERVSLFNLFNYDEEIKEQSKHPLGSAMVFVVSIGVLLLLVSSIFYIVMNKIYERRILAIKKSSVTWSIRETIKKARASFVADIDLIEDDGNEIINELMKSSQSGLMLK